MADRRVGQRRHDVGILILSRARETTRSTGGYGYRYGGPQSNRTAAGLGLGA